MSYLVLARKYRPQSFSDVIGQEHITHILERAVREGKPRHAYLFCGSRGTGKTTCARILARELNARSGQQAGMLDLGMQTSLDVIEIDGASNNSVEDVRSLRENVRLVPMSGGYKVYIIDEVHMLSDSAFNALLKTLEEPPSHVVFIFATTDPGKLPPTVLSRCQRFDFKRIAQDKIVAYLQEICQKEAIAIDEDALGAIARAAQGGMRDALSVLDQVSAAGVIGRISCAVINDLFGLVEPEQVSSFVGALVARDFAAVERVLDQVVEKGKDIKHFLSDLVQFFRHIMLIKVGGKDLESLVDLPRSQKEIIFQYASALTVAQIVRCLEVLIQAQDVARMVEDSRLALELASVKILSDILAETGTASGPLVIQAERKAPAVSRPAAVKPAVSVPVALSVNIAGDKRDSSVVTKSVSPVRPQNAIPGGGVSAVSPATVFCEEESSGQSVSVEVIRNRWNELTFAVSQRKISVGTYLQQGVPVSVVGTRVHIGFLPENAFDRECLDTPENSGLVADVISSLLGVPLQVAWVVTEASVRHDLPVADEAVEMFDGEIVNEWHNDE